MENIITLKDVSLVYSSAEALSVKKIVKMLLSGQRKPKLRSEYQALHGISFSILRGSVYGIIGRNGAGKSTLLRILSGSMSPTSGTVERNYQTINLLALGVGFTKDLTGYENIFLNGMILGFSKQVIQEKLQEIISYSELGDFIYKPMKTYSSGMISRLAFSIGIHLKPDVLLVDEILSVGDARFQEKSFRSIREYIEAENTTAVLVSHSMQQIRSLCECCIWLEKGELIAMGDTQTVTDAYDQVNQGKMTLAQAKEMLRLEKELCTTNRN
ncbi:MAG: ABC transporter ATP-binding protein [Candidatus Faecousia sp.]|nr:ABC transporter ATP-binding protein [Candidatus Faecousia sp.]